MLSSPDGDDPQGPRWLALFVVVALAATAAALPALRGDWVYDDQILPGHSLLRGVRDAGRAFRRNSEHYVPRSASNDPAAHIAITYRPVPMASFALTAAVAGDSPRAHHLVSLAFHLGLVLLLSGLAAVRGRLSWTAALLVAAFALHPCLTESWQWIGGRSDSLAALALAGLALLRRRAPARRRGAALLPVLLFGALCKETFLIAAAALLIAEAWSEWRESRRPWVSGWPTVLAWTAAAATLWGARAITLDGPASLGPLLSLRGLLAHTPRLAALGFESLAVPLPRPMRMLSWELSRPWTAAHLAVLAALAGVVVLMVKGRSWRALILLLGAIATLAPAALLAQAFWLGFDRYLTPCAVLLVIAALPVLSRWRPARSRPIAHAAGGVLLLLVLAGASHASARFYRSHATFCWSMLDGRPEDPTGFLMVALDTMLRGEPDRAAIMLFMMPKGALPPSLVRRVVPLALELGRVEEAAESVSGALAAYPDDARVGIALIMVRAAERRWAEVERLAASTAQRWPERRPQLARLLGRLAQRAPKGVAARLHAESSRLAHLAP